MHDGISVLASLIAREEKKKKHPFPFLSHTGSLKVLWVILLAHLPPILMFFHEVATRSMWVLSFTELVGNLILLSKENEFLKDTKSYSSFVVFFEQLPGNENILYFGNSCNRWLEFWALAKPLPASVWLASYWIIWHPTITTSCKQRGQMQEMKWKQ